VNRIDKKFEELKNRNKKGFVAYITAGDPCLETTEKLVLELEKSGVDFLELGVPFSDPMADGAVIQRASERALKAKTNLHKILLMIKKLRKKTDIPIILFTYMNPVFCYGWSKFSNNAKKCGVDGVLVLDLPVEESEKERKILASKEIKMIYLVAPTSSDDRARLICKNASGFIYYVSRTGVTGVQDSVAHDIRPMVNKLRRFTRLPVAVGFGISKTEHVASVSRYADAIVVGSAIVSSIEKNLKNKNVVINVGKFVKKLKGEI